MERIAPSLDLYLWRPVLAGHFTHRDLNEWVTLSDLLDAHEVLDLKEAMEERAAEKED